MAIGVVTPVKMSQNSTEPSRDPFVVIEEPSEPRPTANPPPGRPVPVIDERVVQPLMIPLAVVTFEAGTPNVLFHRGFTKQSLLPGVEMVIDGYQAKDGSRRTAAT